MVTSTNHNLFNIGVDAWSEVAHHTFLGGEDLFVRIGFNEE